MRAIRLAAGAVLALAIVAGCAGRTPAPTLWRLEPAAPMPDAWRPGAPGVFVGAVNLPRYLRRPEVLEQVAPGRLEPATYDRWAEPLEDGVVRVLAEDLARRLASPQVAAYPATPRFPVEFHVAVDVERLDGQVGGSVALVARWSVLAGIGGPVIAGAREDVAVPAGDGMAGFVAAHGRALSELAERIARAVAAAPRPAAGGPEGG